MNLDAEQKQAIHATHVELDSVDHKTQEMDVSVYAGQARIAQARIDPIMGDVDFIDPVDDEDLIRHFGIEATRPGADPEFDELRSDFERVLATRISSAQMLGFPPRVADDLPAPAKPPAPGGPTVGH